MTREFRDELQDRLAIVDDRDVALQHEYERERAVLEERIGRERRELHEERQALRKLIELEDNRLGIPAPLRSPPKVDLGEFFLVEILMHGERTKEELKIAAIDAGYFRDGESAGRSTHATLTNYVRHGRLRQLPGARYDLPKAELVEVMRPGVIQTAELPNTIAAGGTAL
jgi:hypothetical protein